MGQERDFCRTTGLSHTFASSPGGNLGGKREREKCAANHECDLNANGQEKEEEEGRGRGQNPFSPTP